MALQQTLKVIYLVKIILETGYFHYKIYFQQMVKGFLAMKVNEKNILEEVEKTLRACLQRVPFLEIESLERERKVGDVCIDIAATVRLAKQRQRLALEVKNNGQPRVARAAAYQLARVLESEPGIYGVFAAPYISPQTAEICVKEKIGYLDLAGNCRLTFGQVYIEQEGKQSRDRFLDYHGVSYKITFRPLACKYFFTS